MAHTPVDSYEAQEEIEEITITDMASGGMKGIHIVPYAMSTFTKCTVITASGSASQVPITHGGLVKLSQCPGLSANMLHCTQLGLNTFRKAHTEMKTIASWALTVAKTGGTIEKIMKLLAKPPSGPVNELINIYMGILGEASVKCKTASDGMKQSCDEWNNFLQLFHKVVKSKKDEINTEERTTKDKSNQQKEKVEVARACETRAKVSVDKEEANLEETREEHERISTWLDNTWKQSTGLHAISAAGMSGIHYLYAKYRTGSARERYEATIRMRENAELERKALEVDLKKLSDQNTSLDEVKDIIGRAIDQLSQLQGHIMQLLLLFEDVSGKVQKLQETNDVTFRAEAKCYVLENESGIGDIQDLRAAAAEVRKEFANIHLIAAVYAEASSDVIMPGFEKLNEYIESVSKSGPAEQRSKYEADALVNIDQWREDADKRINSSIRRILNTKSDMLKLLEPSDAQIRPNEIQV